jgi:hypothetical protein
MTPTTIQISVGSDTTADDLHKQTVTALNAGHMVLWMASTRRRKLTDSAARKVEADHPGAVGAPTIMDDHKLRIFWWPANVSPEKEMISWWPGGITPAR